MPVRTLATGTGRAALLDLAVYLHVHVTRVWLMHCAAPEDLIRRTVFLALRQGQERDEVSTLAVARFGVVDALLTSGAVEQGLAELDSLILPPVTAETGGLVAVTTAAHAAAAMLDGRPDDAETAMQSAAELAARFGETRAVNSLGFMYSPIDAAAYRMWLALESGEPDRAVTLSRQLHPEHHPFRTMQTYYWVGYGLALAQMSKSYREAVMALRTAERLYPNMVLRHAKVRDTLACLMKRSIPGEWGSGAAGDGIPRGSARVAVVSAERQMSREETDVARALHLGDGSSGTSREQGALAVGKPTIAFVTSNVGKYATACEHLSPAGIELEQVKPHLDEIQSDSVTTVALHKAQQAFQILRRPLIIEDSGFYIDELRGFPGPFVKYVVKSLGAEGFAHLADLTTTRRRHFEGVLVYIDAQGVPRTFTDSGDGGTIADKPTDSAQPGAGQHCGMFHPSRLHQAIVRLTRRRAPSHLRRLGEAVGLCPFR